MISLVSSSTRSGSRRRFSICLSRMETAVRPISAQWLPDRGERGHDDQRLAGVVEADDRQVARQPQPPRSRAACAAPMAMLSLNAKIAVGGPEADRAAHRPPRCPPSMRKFEYPDRTRVRQHAGTRRAPRDNRKPLLAGRPALRAADHTDPAVAEFEQVTGCLGGSRMSWPTATTGGADVQLAERVHDHEPEAVAGQWAETPRPTPRAGPGSRPRSHRGRAGRAEIPPGPASAASGTARSASSARTAPPRRQPGSRRSSRDARAAW